MCPNCAAVPCSRCDKLWCTYGNEAHNAEHRFRFMMTYLASALLCRGKVLEAVGIPLKWGLYPYTSGERAIQLFRAMDVPTE
jgi:hypothetical protein